jgi:hypothetical protein
MIFDLTLAILGGITLLLLGVVGLIFVRFWRGEQR